MARAKSRFNLLLLEEGEYLLEEYSATCTLWRDVNVDTAGALAPPEWRARGRIRVCTRSLHFEPEDARLPLMKWPYRGMAGRPTALASWPLGGAAEMSTLAAADGQSGRDAFVCQVATVIEMKPGGVVGPYKPRVLWEPPPPAADVPTPGGQSSSLTAKARGLLGGTSKPAAAAAAAASTPAADSSAPKPSRPTLLVALQHASVSTVLSVTVQMWEVQQAAATAHASFERAALAGVVAARREGGFILSLLSDYREKPLLPVNPAIPVERVFPLVTCPGRIMLTSKALYVQPVALNNVAGGDPVTRWWLRDVRRVIRRSRLLQQVGLEVLLKDRAVANSAADGAAAGLRADSPAANSVFLVFQTRTDRDTVYRALLELLRGGPSSESPSTPAAPAAAKPVRDARTLPIWRQAAASPDEYDDTYGDGTRDGLLHATRAWQERALSNYDYLCVLNSVAGRTVSDLTQYPVFPWVIADYKSRTLDLGNPATYRDLSKPMGALNPSRLNDVQTRFREMPREEGMDPPFLWGTHYSTPGYCLYYLVRSMPEHMLRLQSGKFDAPDRMFFDLAATWAGVTSVNMDVKELTPEFYSSDGSFLLLPDGLDLGVRQNGKRVADVTLPEWAFDAGDFVARCREALESDFVSAQLHEWIDLVFGFKQRGKPAEDANNVFYFMTYEGAVDVDSIADPERRLAVQQQLAEFGQTPRQILDAPHPARSGPAVERPIERRPPIRDDQEPAPSPTVTTADPAPCDDAVTTLSSEGGPSMHVVEAQAVARTAKRWTWEPCCHAASADVKSTAGTLHSDHKESVLACAATAESSGESSSSVRVWAGGRDGAVSACEARVGVGSTVLMERRATWRLCTPASDDVFNNPALLLYTSVYPAAALPVPVVAPLAQPRVCFAACWDHSIAVLCFKSGKRLAAWPAHDGVPTCLAALHCGRAGACDRVLLASGGADGAVRVWSLEVSDAEDHLTVACYHQPSFAASCPAGSTPTALSFRMSASCVALCVGGALGDVRVLELLPHWQRSPRCEERDWVQRFGTQPRQAAAAATLPEHPDHLCTLAPLSDVATDVLVSRCTHALGDIGSFGLSGVSAIAARVGQTDEGSLHIVVTTSAGHIAAFRWHGSADHGTAELQLCKIINTGEVLRSVCTLDDSVVLTAGNSGTVRGWFCPCRARDVSMEEDADGAVLFTLRPGQSGQTHNDDDDDADARSRAASAADKSLSFATAGRLAAAVGSMRRKRPVVSWQVRNAEDVGKQPPPEQWLTCVSAAHVVQSDGEATVIVAGSRAGDMFAWLARHYNT